jgi:ribosomal protein S18 acetylase RimI-like enzyme
MGGVNLKACRDANLGDLSAVTEVHMKAFPGFFLTTLGASFVRTMYQAFLLNSNGIFVVAEVDARVCGFAVGALKSSNKDSKLAMRLLPQFVWAVIPAVLQNPFRVLTRIASQFFEQNGAHTLPSGAAVLRSIGILPELKGQGAASLLLLAFEQRAMQMGATSLALTTDVLDNERAIQFYCKHGYQIAQEFKQDKHRAMFLMLKELR